MYEVFFDDWHDLVVIFVVALVVSLIHLAVSYIVGKGGK